METFEPEASDILPEVSDPAALGRLSLPRLGDTSMALMDEPSFKLDPDARHRQAREVGRLDFAAPGPMSPPDQADEPELWEAFQQAYTNHDDPGIYVPFLASEVHTRSGGDRNVVFREWKMGTCRPFRRWKPYWKPTEIGRMLFLNPTLEEDRQIGTNFGQMSNHCWK